MVAVACRAYSFDKYQLPAISDVSSVPWHARFFESTNEANGIPIGAIRKLFSRIEFAEFM